jgi:Family of unknown function (DUF6515)
MKFAKPILNWKLGVSFAALLVAWPLLYAQQRQQQGDHPEPQRSQPAPRPEPARAPVQHTQPVVVDRANHGTVRHVDTHVVPRPVQRPIETHPGFDGHHDVYVHHDVDVDFHHPRFWNGFRYGARFNVLPVGYVSIFVGGSPYYYDDGLYYQQVDNGYQEVYPPVGADVPQPPDGAYAIDAGNQTYYYAGGAFYVQQGDGYVIAPPPIGVTVPELPPGAVQVAVNGGIAYQFNGIYYRPVFVDGVTQYMTFMP